MNTGHDVKIVLDDPSPHIINITGGPLSYKYRVSEISFHWGSIDTLGSEHTIDGQSFPAEVCRTWRVIVYNENEIRVRERVEENKAQFPWN